jgi:hypothetical protein
MTRFFMSITEASQLVLQGAAMGKGGEIFILDMGEPVKIVDLARDLVRLSGLPDDSIEVRFTGIRPGEKLYEELYFVDERTLSTAHPKLRAAYHRPYALDEVSREVDQLLALAHGPDGPIRKTLHEFVPEFEGTTYSNGRLLQTSSAPEQPRDPHPMRTMLPSESLAIPLSDAWVSAGPMEASVDDANGVLGYECEDVAAQPPSSDVTLTR